MTDQTSIDAARAVIPNIGTQVERGRFRIYTYITKGKDMELTLLTDWINGAETIRALRGIAA